MTTEQKPKKSCGERLKLPIIILLCLAVCALAITIIFLALEVNRKDKVSDGSEDEPTEEPIKSKYGTYRYAAVAADNEVCSQIGTNILGQRQGSAVDAAVASLLCLGVVHPQSTGIGGGFFMTIYDKDKNDTEYKMTALVARETAPANATEDMYMGDVSSTLGGSAIGVPGEVKGLHQAWMRYGRVEWKDLIQPSIDLCEGGVRISSHAANAIKSASEDIKKDAVLREIFFKSDSSPLEEGDIFKNTKLAETLKRIALDPESFYNGTLAEEISQDIIDHGGIISVDDLRSYSAVWKDPVSVHFDNGNFTLYGPPPPSSAVVLQFALNILDGYNLTPSDFKDTKSKVLTYHRLAESLKFAFGKRSLLGDEDYEDVAEPMDGLPSWLTIADKCPEFTTWKAHLTNDSLANELRQRILDNMTRQWQFYDPAFDIVEDDGTSHLSVLAPDGSAVAVTSTINLYFGSKRAGSRTGIVFNNEMDDFSTPNTTNYFNVPASPANYIKPGKRPMSSMSPSIALDKDGKVVLIVGASGGTKIISATAQVTMNNLWSGHNIAEAIDRSRIHHQLIPEQMYYEPTLSKDVQEGLKAKKHELEVKTSIAVCQAISTLCTDCDCQDGCIMAASDFRKGGAPDGF